MRPAPAPALIALTALALLSTGVACGSEATDATDGSTLAPPDPPRDFLAFGEDGRIVLAWGYPDDTLQKGVHITWGVQPGELDEYLFVTSPRTRYELAGLTNGATYAFRMELEHATGLRSGPTAAKLAIPGALDREPPRVVDVGPADHAVEVAQDAPITVAFSEPMALESVEIAVVPPRAFLAPRWDGEGRSLSLWPASPWEPATTHTFSVTGRDRADNLLTATPTITFTTGCDRPAPSVVAISPHDGMNDVPNTARITVTFDEPMEPTSVARALEVHPRVGCSPVPDEGARTFTCTPGSPLSEGTLYGILVGTQARARRGPALAQAVGVTFTAATRAEIARPALVSSTPDDGALGVPRHFVLALRFDEPMDQPSTQAALRFPTHPALTGTFTWTPDGRELRFEPAADLPYGERVGWTLDASAHDLAGHPLDAPRAGAFQLVRRERRVLEGRPELDGTVAEPSVDASGASALGAAIVDHASSIVSVGRLPASADEGGLGDGQVRLARGFFTFELAELPESLTTITFAELRLPTRWWSAPSGAPAGIVVESIDLGFELNELDYLAPVDTGTVCAGRAAATCTFGPLIVESREAPASASAGWRALVTPLVARDWDLRVERAYLSAVRVRLSTETATPAETVELTAAHPWVPERYRPRLLVEYEVP